jgi:SAM-dependent methyltransferase
MAGGSDVRDGPIIAALTNTGSIGSTVRQLAVRLRASPSHVSERLEDLRGRGRVLQIGRGLWIPSEFAVLSERSDFVDPAAYVEDFQRTSGIALGSYHGPITFGSNEVLPVHRWWTYVQGFSASFVRFQIDTAQLSREGRVVDPFCGSGTTLVEARRAGLLGIGSDLLGPAVLAARVKTDFELSPTRLEKAAASYLARARTIDPAKVPFLRETRRQFTPSALQKLLSLRAALPFSDSSRASDALRVAFDRILIPSSLLRRSPCLGYRPAHSAGPVEPFAAFLAAVNEMRSDLAELHRDRPRWGPPARVRLGDSRALRLSPESVDLAVTSPPYVNGMDYVMNYKLDLAWLGYVDGYAGLARLRERMVACDNLSRQAADPYTTIANVPDPWLGPILEQVRHNVREKGTYRRQDVHAIVHRYFADLVPVLRLIKNALKPGGAFVIVVGDSLLAGTYIPGDLLLARLGARVGLRVEAVDVARERRSGQRRSFRLRESVVTLRKPRP